jgi:hypothetical protein
VDLLLKVNESTHHVLRGLSDVGTWHRRMPMQEPHIRSCVSATTLVQLELSLGFNTSLPFSVAQSTAHRRFGTTEMDASTFFFVPRMPRGSRRRRILKAFLKPRLETTDKVISKRMRDAPSPQEVPLRGGNPGASWQELQHNLTLPLRVRDSEWWRGSESTGWEDARWCVIDWWSKKDTLCEKMVR